MADKPKRRWLRFSLRTLLILVLTIGSATTLWRRWEPWQVDRSFMHAPDVKDAGMSADGRFVFTLREGSRNRLELDGHEFKFVATHEINEVRIWDAATGANIHAFQGGFSNDGFGGGAKALSSPLGHFILLQSHDNILHWEKIWNVETGAEVPLGEPGALWTYQFSPDDTHLLVAKSGNLELVNLSDNSRRSLAEGHPEPAVFTSDETKAVFLYGNGHVYIWNIAQAKLESTFSIMGRAGENNPNWNSLSISTDNKRIAVGAYSYSGSYTRVLDSGSGTELLALKGCAPPTTEYSFSLARDGTPFSPDCEHLLTQDSAEAFVWDLKSGKETAHLYGIQRDVPAEWHFTPSGDRIVLIQYDRVRVWNASTGDVIFSLGETGVLSPDSKYLLTLRKKPNIRSVENGNVISTLNTSDLRCASFQKDHIVAINQSDGLVQIWSRRRPEAWWGAGSLPEFWLTTLFVGLLIWSVWRDRRTMV